MRTERDTLGERMLPDDALYGINTVRALDNFALGGHTVRHSLIRAMILVKKAAAQTYLRIGEGRPDVEQAIVTACDHLLTADLTAAFPLQALQGGAGTSTHMNVNEVLANLALRELGYEPGRYDIIHPLDDVNRGQSTNDVYPTALRIASIRQLALLSGQCAKLQTALQEKENAWEAIPKLGRTEWMDAVPITLGEEFGAYAQAIARDRWRLYKAEERLRVVNIGGAAVGTSQGAARQYRFGIIEELRRLTGIGLAAAEYPMDITQNNDVFVEVSGLVKALAVNLMKIADDLRRMNSGPYGGLGEVRLAKLQQGSSIMPGKVNPVIPEMTIQCAIKVMANDSAISQAASHGEFELNAFLPLIADCILESLELLTECTRLFSERCIKPLEADVENCRRHLEASHAPSMAWAPVLGYDTVAAIVRDYPPEEARNRLQLESERKRKETEGEGKSDSD